MRGKRKDIQGLRAVAVVLVIANHLGGRPSGGYIGVDVFFVISGFLITGLLLHEYSTSGRISLSQFYRRRARRLVPAAAVVLASTVAASWVLPSAVRARSTTVDAIWAALTAANWRFWSSQTDYLREQGPPSPLQHFWSLSVEEQFYFAWPVLIIAIAALAVRSRRDPRRLAAVFLTVATALSFDYAMWDTATSPASAYFSTFTRVWELGAGALLAVGEPALGRIPGALRPVMGWAGTAVILGSALLLTDSSAVPGPWAAAPVLGAMLVIAAGAGHRARFQVLLTNRVSRYIGDISYSLYLWHFPVIVLGALFLGPVSATSVAVSVAVMTALGVLSYHLIENPVRKSSWLSPARVRLPVLAGTAAAVAAVLVTAGCVLTSAAPTPAPETTQAAPVVDAAVLEHTLAAGVTAALASTSWPDLTPSRDTRMDFVTPSFGGPCFNHAQLSVDDCVYGDPAGTKTAVVVGDSIAASWMPGISAALAPEGYRVLQIGNPNCPFLDADVLVPLIPEQAHLCNEVRPRILRYLAKTSPDLVILSDVENGIGRLASGATGPAAVAEWATARAKVISAITPTTPDVVILAPDPVGVNIENCAPLLTTPAGCVATVTPEWMAKRDGDMQAAIATGARYIDTRPWFCDAANQCPVFASGMLMRWDEMHLTTTYSKYLAPVLGAVLLHPQ